MASCSWILGLLYAHAFVLFSSSSVSAVTLRQWDGDQCTGDSSQCSNIGANRCCGSPPALSVSCKENCGTNVLFARNLLANDCLGFYAARRGGEHNCLWSPNQRTQGQTWRDVGFPRSIAAAGSSLNVEDSVFDFANSCELEETGGECKGSVFPDLWKIDGRFFKVNGSTPQTVNDTLMTSFGTGAMQRASGSKILEKLAPYEIDKPEDWDDEDGE